MTRNEIADRFGMMWKKSRSNAGVSQEYMAKALGVSKKTIQNWEAGIGAPNQIVGFEWFHVLGLQPLPYYLDLLYGKCEDVSGEGSKKLDTALMESINRLNPYMKRKLLYILDADHGSSTAGVLDMVVAHLHCPLPLRIGVAQHILSNYQISEEYNANSDLIKCDTDILMKSIENCKRAVRERKSKYSNIYDD